MSDTDRSWLAAVVGPQVAYWAGWALLLPASGPTVWLLPTFKQAYVLGLVPTTVWSLVTGLGLWPADTSGDWPRLSRVWS